MFVSTYSSSVVPDTLDEYGIAPDVGHSGWQPNTAAAATTTTTTTIIIIIIIIITIDMNVSNHRSFFPGTSLEPAVIPTAQASSFTLQYFPYYV